MQVSNFCIRTSQWKSCCVENVCLPHALDMDILLVVWKDNRDQYCEFFLCETLVRELNFEKSPAGPGGPRRFNGQNRTWSWGIFLDLSYVRGISREWLCGSACSFYILMFSCYVLVCLFVCLFVFCSAYVIRLFGRCSRVLDPALDASPLKISSHLQWIFTIMITACLELLSLTQVYYSWIGCFCYFWSPTSLCLFSFECW